MALSKINFLGKDWCLEDVLPVYTSKRYLENCKIKISPEGLSLSNITQDTVKQKKHSSLETFIETNDIIGCSYQKSKVSSISILLTIFSYPLLKSKKVMKRKRCAFTLEFGKLSSLQGNLDSATLWEKAVHALLNNRAVSDQTSECSPREGKLLILINPNSGPGKAYQIFKKQVVPILSEANATYDVVITQRALHAKDMVHSLSLQQYKAIVVVAGDGLLYEVFNGLGSREDWQNALTTPVCVIPGGSGNGLAKSLAHWRKEPFEGGIGGGATTSALNLICGHPSPMDLVCIHTSSGERLFSFLSFGIGLLSDIDIESERLRMLGDARFTLWAVARVASLRKYSVTVSFKRIPGNFSLKSSQKTQPLRAPIERSQTVQEETFSTPPQYLDKRHGRSARPLLHRQLNHSVSCDAHMPVEGSESDTDSTLSSIELSKYPSLEKVVTMGDKDSTTNSDVCKNPDPASSDQLPQSSVVSTSSASEKTHSSVATDTSETRKKKTSTRKADYSQTQDHANQQTVLSQPVPDDWEVIKGEFVLVYAAYQTHISSNVFFAPAAAPADGIMWLTLLPGQMTRASVTKFLLQMETGSHCDLPGVMTIPVTAVRLQPHDEHGLITVDGEVVPFGDLQAEIMPSAARVMVRS